MEKIRPSRHAVTCSIIHLLVITLLYDTNVYRLASVIGTEPKYNIEGMVGRNYSISIFSPLEWNCYI